MRLKDKLLAAVPEDVRREYQAMVFELPSSPGFTLRLIRPDLKVVFTRVIPCEFVDLASSSALKTLVRQIVDIGVASLEQWEPPTPPAPPPLPEPSFMLR